MDNATKTGEALDLNKLIDGCESIAAHLDDAMKPKSAAKIRELIALARRSLPVDAAGIKTWNERTEARAMCLPLFEAMRDEIYDLRAALARAGIAADAGQAEPVAKLSSEQIFSIAAPYFKWNAPRWQEATQGTITMTGLLGFADALHLAAPVSAGIAAPAAPTAEQPLIGKLLDQFSELPVLWGLNEPGALVRHSDVFRMLIDAGKAQKDAQKEGASVLPAPPLMRQAVAQVDWREGDDLGVRWLRPERVDVGALLYCAAEPIAAQPKDTTDTRRDA